MDEDPTQLEHPSNDSQLTLEHTINIKENEMTIEEKIETLKIANDKVKKKRIAVVDKTNIMNNSQPSKTVKNNSSSSYQDKENLCNSQPSPPTKRKMSSNTTKALESHGETPIAKRLRSRVKTQGVNQIARNLRL